MAEPVDCDNVANAPSSHLHVRYKQMNASEETLRELIKERLENQRQLNELCLKCCAVWLVVLGILFRYTFEEDQSNQHLFATLGVVFSALGIASCYCGYLAGRNVDTDVKRMNKELGEPLKNTRNSSFFAALICCAIFDALTLLAFASPLVT